MNDAIAAAIIAAAETPTITEDTARFPDGTTIVRRVIHYPATPTYLPNDDGQMVKFGDGSPHTLTMFEIRDADGRLLDTTTRMTVDLEA